ncbi:MAG: tyrosine--tRNA ligase [Thermoguttaceae bacterium]|nr:tyrosine--tRNA ligase [Thermoguttaceae bacterium]MDW8079080.1 tyrosine--tRNA ligase [Thermoguttaceae bacterium]
MTINQPVKDIIADLRFRGLIYQTTDDERIGPWLCEQPRTLYAGFDPTADSLHVGHLLGIIMLRRFQKAGHRPIALVGGATGMVGDPSGKTQERPLLPEETLRANVGAIQRQLERFLDFSPGTASAILVNNYEWMSRFGYLQFLREVGKHFPVNVMLSKDCVRSRLERSDAGLSYTEFSYMLLQAYDFVYLYQHYGCQLQIGGSDQWGNITAGIDLGRRMIGVELWGLTWPLLTTSEGSKMGKTEAGTIWLAPDKTSPYQFYQYWINTADADVMRFVLFFTEVTPHEYQELYREFERDPSERTAQRYLARELTRLVHGPEGLATAERATRFFFGEEIESGSDDELESIFGDVPSGELPRNVLDEPGLPLVDALVACGLAKTKSEARRLINQGGAYVNNRRVADIEKRLTAGDLASPSIIILRTGRKNYALLRFR